MNGESVFDSVIISNGATPRRLSPAEFFELPLSERIQHVIARTASFYSAGREIDRVKALAEIRRARVRHSD